MTLKQLILEAENKFKKAGIKDAGQDAMYLAQEICGITRNDLILNGGREVPADVQEKYFRAIELRSRHIPCQYITGKAYFMDYCFTVNENVLIPRQDTEVLVEQALEFIKNSGVEKPAVLDICTGSGCIAVSLKAICPGAAVSAIDISEKALEVARQNATDILEGDREIRFILSDLIEGLAPEEKFDMIVSNPPYVSEGEFAGLEPEVKEKEPALALLAGPEGLDIYRRLIPQAAEHLKENGALMLEIGCSQAAAVSELLQKSGFKDIRVIKDLSGLDRVVSGTAPDGNSMPRL